MPNELDELMDLDPLEMTPDNIDQIILHYRNNRAKVASGVKVVKEKGPKISLDGLLDSLIPAKPQPTLKRRL